MKRKLRTRKLPAGITVMPKPCSTCPFATKSGATLGEGLTNYVEQVVTLQSQHLCHSARNKKLCRGARDLMLRVMTCMKLIDAPTDEAFNRASAETLRGSK
jgi:hypothetical protein